MKCNNCSTENASGVKFCHECGTKFETTKTCSNAECGRGDLPTNAKFCPDCGSELDGNNVQQIRQVSNSKENYLDENVIQLIPVKKNGRWGYINALGDIVIDCYYDYAKPFSDGLALVCMNTKYGWIDATGKFVIDCVFDMATSFIAGIAKVKRKSEYYYINKNGEKIIDADDSWIWGGTYSGNEEYYELPYSEGLLRVCKNGKYGFIDKYGQTKIDCVWRQAVFF